MSDRESDPELFKLATDKCLFEDEGFRPFAQKYKESQEAFFEDYKKVRAGISLLKSSLSLVVVMVVLMVMLSRVALVRCDLVSGEPGVVRFEQRGRLT